ncbi:cupin domain protein [Rhodococcus erythropolis]|uniref:Cupin domain protein n=1 Tax=Rhodococcus erythropolis TaxID=1833 RepID=A0A6G9CYQ2_RHOER|nr:cupin domain protein [Rhodococcus erythropolis]
MLPFLGIVVRLGTMNVNGPHIDAAISQIGARLKRIRTQRNVTLTALSESTGISKSTLSRLEAGERRPSLELLLPIALAHQVPLDQLVAAPQVADPRIQSAPRSVSGRTVLPLTRQPGGLQAFKMTIPASQTEPDPQVHDGYEWLYVLSGRLRLVLADHDIVMGTGEAAEFDTRNPHWFGSDGRGPGRGTESVRPPRRTHPRSGQAFGEVTDSHTFIRCCRKRRGQ